MWGEPRDYEETHLASPQEAVNEWARNVGAERLDCQWLLHDWDVWVRNPPLHWPRTASPRRYWGLDGMVFCRWNSHQRL
jgi:hypothetical protein